MPFRILTHRVWIYWTFCFRNKVLQKKHNSNKQSYKHTKFIELCWEIKHTKLLTLLLVESKQLIFDRKYAIDISLFWTNPKQCITNNYEYHTEHHCVYFIESPMITHIGLFANKITVCQLQRREVAKMTKNNCHILSFDRQIKLMKILVNGRKEATTTTQKNRRKKKRKKYTHIGMNLYVCFVFSTRCRCQCVLCGCVSACGFNDQMKRKWNVVKKKKKIEQASERANGWMGQIANASVYRYMCVCMLKIWWIMYFEFS